MRLRRVLIDAPRCVEANLALGTLLTETMRASFALEHFRRAREVAGSTPFITFKIGWCQRQAGDVPAAIATFRELVEIDGKNPQAWVALISAQEAAGELDAAAAAIEHARSQFPLTADLRRVTAVVMAARKDFAGAIALLADQPTPVELLDRGRFKEKLGDYDGAWADWMTAKERLRQAGHHYNAEGMARRVALLREAARPERQHWIGRASPCPPPVPIFVCGFPRSGTTMVEASLSAHSKIAAGDEMMFLSECIALLPQMTRAGLPYPMALLATSAGENDNGIALNVLQKYYWEKARAKIGFARQQLVTEDLAAATPAYITDKMCLNELHLPFILALFPNAYVRRVMRHPLDVIVSCMSHMLAHGGFFASSPEACAQHLAVVDDLVDYYESTFGDSLSRFMTVNYEAFVADHKLLIDRMLPDDLSPEQSCYDFHLNPWHSRTISYRQVHQPLYDSSVGRYRHFCRHLEPLIPLLKAACERRGYAIDS